MAESVTLRAVLSDYPHTVALKSGARTSPHVRLAFDEIEPVHKAFAPMVREGAWDLCELAVVTALQAIAFNRPIVLLPAVVASRFQRGCLIRRTGDAFAPEALIDKRIAVRAYTQTTGMWVRAHLAEDFGLPIEQMRWMTQDPAHVAAYRDPSFVSPAPAKSLPAMLRDGDIDAAILGNDLPKGDEFVAVIADAAARDRAWGKAQGFMPINHMVAVTRDVARAHPAAVRAAYDLLASEAATVSAPDDGPGRTLFGLDVLRAPLQMIIDTCERQALLPRRLTLDDVLGEAAELLEVRAD